MFKIVLHDRAKKSFERLPTHAARLVSFALEELRLDPLGSPHIKKLHGEWQGYFRLRVGSYRIVYYVDDAQNLIFVDDLGPRGNIY